MWSSFDLPRNLRLQEVASWQDCLRGCLGVYAEARLQNVFSWDEQLLTQTRAMRIAEDHAVVCAVLPLNIPETTVVLHGMGHVVSGSDDSLHLRPDASSCNERLVQARVRLTTSHSSASSADLRSILAKKPKMGIYAATAIIEASRNATREGRLGRRSQQCDA